MCNCCDKKYSYIIKLSNICQNVIYQVHFYFFFFNKIKVYIIKENLYEMERAHAIIIGIYYKKCDNKALQYGSEDTECIYTSEGLFNAQLTIYS